MKKLFLALLALVLICGTLTSLARAASRLNGTKEISHLSGEDNSNASVTLVSAASGATTRIYKLAYKIDGADTVTLSCGISASAKSKYTFGAEGGAVITPYPFYIECDSNTAVTLTKGTAGTLLQYDLWYQQDAN